MSIYQDFSKADTTKPISFAWLWDSVVNKLDRHDDMCSMGARNCFNDLMTLGLINEDKINWDTVDEVEETDPASGAV